MNCYTELPIINFFKKQVILLLSKLEESSINKIYFSIQMVSIKFRL